MPKIDPGCLDKVNIFLSQFCYCGHIFSNLDAEEETLSLGPFNLTEYFDEATNQKFNQICSWQRSAWKKNISPDLPIDQFWKTYGYLSTKDWLKGSTALDQGQYVQYLESHSQENKWQEQWIKYHLFLECGT